MSRFRSIVESTAFPTKSEMKAEFEKWKLTTAERNKEKRLGLAIPDTSPHYFSQELITYYDDDYELHREGGPASIDFIHGGYEWRIHGDRHRDGGGPAVYLPGRSMIWYNHGKIHRVGAPAIVRDDGTYDFYINHKYMSHHEAAKHFGD